VKSHIKFGPDRFSSLTFIGYKQTDKQSIGIDYCLRHKIIYFLSFLSKDFGNDFYAENENLN